MSDPDKMSESRWLYVAPHRTRDGRLDLPKCQDWADIHDLNLQRLARALEFQGCIAFVGSGACIPLGYPSWKELLPGADNLRKEPDLCALLEPVSRMNEQVTSGKFDVSQGIEIAEKWLAELLSLRGKGHDSRNSGRDFIVKDLRTRFEETQPKYELSPFPALLDLPIRRFLTTNYDREIENALALRLGKHPRWFSQDKQEDLAIFAIALAQANRNMVFHCHGALADEQRSRGRHLAGTSHRSYLTLVLTDSDYNHWYLSSSPDANTFQLTFEVILQSNPLLFVGYSLSDFDIVRIFRHLSIQRRPGRAPNVFAVVDHTRKDLLDYKDGNMGLRWQARQIKWQMNVIPYPLLTGNPGEDLPDARPLCEELKRINEDYKVIRRSWREQPKAKKRSYSAVLGRLRPRVDGEGRSAVDPLFDPKHLAADKFLQDIETEMSSPRSRGVVALVGPPGSGKYIKSCQFAATAYGKKFDSFIFHLRNNEDIYSYLKRIVEALSKPDESLKPNHTRMTSITERLESILNSKRNKRLLLVISGLDLFVEYEAASGGEGMQSYGGADDGRTEGESYNEEKQGNEPGQAAKSVRPKPWSGYNNIAGALIELLRRWNDEEKTGNRILITARTLPEPLRVSFPKPIQLNWDREEITPFTKEQVGLKDMPDSYNQLLWSLEDENSGLILAAKFVRDFRWSPANETPEKRLAELLVVLNANAAERGTRVVRHIIRRLDDKTGKEYDELLLALSCFNIPVEEEIVKECIVKVRARPNGGGAEGKAVDLNRLIDLHLLDVLESSGREGEDKLLFSVPPLVKYYCRTIMAGVHQPQRRQCGVHGLLSKGPFPSPGNTETAKGMFDHFADLAFDEIQKLRSGQGAAENARLYTRAVLDLLKSNFACNSVPQWGTFNTYIQMCTLALDLVKNLALAIGGRNEMWIPGDSRTVKDEFSNEGTASPEEFIHFYNELALAYYNDGSVQDCLSVLGLALEWQKVIFREDYHQGLMYTASLNSHLGMAYMQLGRMETARDCLKTAVAAAREIKNQDLALRLEAASARVDHFRGSIDRAASSYKHAVRELGRIGNLRAQSYFMRHWSSLMLRSKDFDTAEHLARSSMSIAASEGSADLVAFSRELVAKICSARGNAKMAIKEYRIALEEAKRLGIARLQADVLLGLARVQLNLGDAGAARQRAIDALKIANEDLLVLRQIKALILLGQTAQEFGDPELGKNYLKHARKLASDSQYLLAENDALEALAELGVGD